MKRAFCFTGNSTQRADLRIFGPACSTVNGAGLLEATTVRQCATVMSGCRLAGLRRENPPL